MRYVYCHPIFDERKCAHRFWYQLRTKFAAADLTLESFDYRGTAEAEGEFSQVSLSSLQDDTAEYLARDRACLIGVRFGASLALDYCISNPDCIEKAILIEPIVDGAAYVEYLRRKQRIKDMMTGSSCNLDERDFENIEGYKTSVVFIEQLQSFSLCNLVQAWPVSCCVYLLQAKNGSYLDSELQRLYSTLKNSGHSVVFEKMSIPIFWERIGSADYNQLTEKILRYCRD